jgi:hypothetical protein
MDGGGEIAMEWINIHAPWLRAPEYIGSDPVSRATWFNVLAYCCEQENGGRIVGGANWKDRQWQQTCGVTRDEVEAANLLLSVDGNDVIVWRYPVDKEQAVRQQREAGKRGGRPVNNPPINPPENPRVNPLGTLPHNGREGKGRGMEREGNNPPNGGAGEFSLSDPETKPPKLPVWTAHQTRINKLFNRRVANPWGDKELKHWRAIRDHITDADLDALERYYAAARRSEKMWFFKSVTTLLSNWNRMMDEARNFKPASCF